LLTHSLPTPDSSTTALVNAFDQYCLSKAANCFFTQALNDRLASAGISNVIAVVTDPGLACTGVNIQHDLTNSMAVFAGAKLKDTNQLHDVAGHHAADGALPMVLAGILPMAQPNDWFSTKGKSATSLQEAALKVDPAAAPSAAVDPLNPAAWPSSSRDLFWSQAVSMAGIPAELTKAAKL
jgi:hypothetical protein